MKIKYQVAEIDSAATLKECDNYIEAFDFMITIFLNENKYTRIIEKVDENFVKMCQRSFKMKN